MLCLILVDIAVQSMRSMPLLQRIHVQYRKISHTSLKEMSTKLSFQRTESVTL